MLLLENIATVNHVVVFLTGDIPFSEGFGGAIYFGWPTESNDVSWQYLGYITNEKPSAIFKLGKVKPEDAVQNPFASVQGIQGQFAGLATGSSALIGILVESHAEIAAKTSAANTAASTVASQTEFCQKMVESFYNHISSFAINQSQMTPAPDSVYFIPVNAATQWYDNFQRKLSRNPNFWKS